MPHNFSSHLKVLWKVSAGAWSQSLACSPLAKCPLTSDPSHFERKQHTVSVLASKLRVVEEPQFFKQFSVIFFFLILLREINK